MLPSSLQGIGSLAGSKTRRFAPSRSTANCPARSALRSSASLSPFKGCGRPATSSRTDPAAALVSKARTQLTSKYLSQLLLGYSLLLAKLLKLAVAEDNFHALASYI